MNANHQVIFLISLLLTTSSGNHIRFTQVFSSLTFSRRAFGRKNPNPNPNPLPSDVKILGTVSRKPENVCSFINMLVVYFLKCH